MGRDGSEQEHPERHRHSPALRSRLGGISVAIVSWSVQLTTDGQDFMQSSRSFQAIATVVLICVGGIFAYRRLQLFRTFEPHLTISHNIRHRFTGDSYTHIDVTATLHNSSKIHLELREGFFLISITRILRLRKVGTRLPYMIFQGIRKFACGKG